MSDNKTYYWLKLPNDFFRNLEMKRLRKLAGGDTYTVIYLKMMLLSLEDNGVLYYDEICPTFSEELSLELDEDEDHIQVVLNFLKSVGLLQAVTANEIELTQVPEMTGSETDVARRVRKHRRREELKGKPDEIANPDVELLQCNTKPLQCNTDVTKCNTEIEKEIEKELEIETESDIRDRTSMGTNVPAEPTINFKDIQDYWNDLELKPAIRNITAKRKSHLRARIKEFDIETVYQMMDKVSKSDFLMKPDNTWFSFDWCINPNNFTKIIEGKYENVDKLETREKTEEEKYFDLVDEWAKG